MNPVLYFYLEKKLRYALKSKTKFFLWILGTIAASILYSFSLSFIIDTVPFHTHITTTEVLFSINIFFGLILFLADIFPAYKEAPHFFPSYYPVGKTIKIVIPFLSYFLRYLVLFVGLTFGLLYFINSHYTLFYLLVSILSISIFYLLNRILKNFIEYEILYAKIIFFASFTVLCISTFLSYHFFQLGSNAKVLFTCLFAFLLLSHFLGRMEVNKVRNYPEVRFLKIHKPYISILTNRNIIIAFGVGMLFKGLMLVAATISIKMRNEPLYDSYLFTWLFASPIIVFTYVAMNFYGFNKNLFLTHIIRDSKPHNLFSIYIKSVTLLTIIDSVFFWFFILLNKDFLSLKNISFYYSLSLLLFFLGFWFSINRPIFKDNFFSFDFNKNNSANLDFLAIFSAVLLFIIVYLLSANLLVLVSSILLIVVSGTYLRRCFYSNFHSIIQNAYRRMNNRTQDH